MLPFRVCELVPLAKLTTTCCWARAGCVSARPAAARAARKNLLIL
jgi:hypothetical protein